MTFQKGQSGNPDGRPKGLVSQAKIREAINAEIPGILIALVERAKAGDVAAAKLLLDRVVPVLRPADATVTLPPAETLADQGKTVIAALSAGEIPPNVASLILHGLSLQARIVEATELLARIEALEKATP